ncbi:CASP-like protein 1 [Cynara cardunculus var. scolymus]|uniref:CASP-like protein 1 n=1 Tax=Cynara cardunculus var. scolymus TaxID=59895 RepID=UPI000D6281DA|nr:CASP-like protein 1 [Cynara cardunculus var. scolymus]
MSAIDITAPPPHATIDMEIPIKSSAPPPPEYKAATGDGGIKGHGHGVVEGILRALLCVTSLAGVIVMVTSKQTELIPISPTMAVPLDAKFNHSPSYTYYVAALSVAFLYSIVTGASSLLALMKMTGGSSGKRQFYMVIMDSLLFGIVASAVGATTGVSYIGLKGNSHSRWHEICHEYDSYCRHLKGSIALSLMSSIELLLLVWLAVYVLSKKIRVSSKY